MSSHPGVNALFESALGVLREQGATIVDRLEVPHVDKLRGAEIEVLLHEFKAGLDAYLAEFGRGAPVPTRWRSSSRSTSGTPRA